MNDHQGEDYEKESCSEYEYELDYKDEDISEYEYGYDDVHGLNKEVLIQLLYRDKNLYESEYEEDDGPVPQRAPQNLPEPQRELQRSMFSFTFIAFD